MENNRYVVWWPWKSFPPDLESNYRLRAQFSRYKTDQEYFNAYNKILEQQLATEVIEEIPNNRTENDQYYLPYRGIIRDHNICLLRYTNCV